MRDIHVCDDKFDAPIVCVFRDYPLSLKQVENLIVALNEVVEERKKQNSKALLIEILSD